MKGHPSMAGFPTAGAVLVVAVFFVGRILSSRYLPKK